MALPGRQPNHHPGWGLDILGEEKFRTPRLLPIVQGMNTYTNFVTKESGPQTPICLY